MRITPHDLASRYAEQVLTWEAKPGLQPMLDYPRGVLTALVELGVMSAEERIGWTARWDRAALPPGPAPEPIATRARELLEREFEPTRDPRAQDPLAQRSRIFSAVKALGAAGAISRNEQREWEERLDQAFPPEPRTPVPYVAREFRGATIGAELRHGGLRLRTVEFFEDCVIVRWHLLVQGHEDRPESLHIADFAADLLDAYGPSTLEDDIGTRYAAVPPPSYSLATRWVLEDPPVLLGATAFIPALPAQASRLLIGCPAGMFEVDCPVTKDT